MVEWLLPPSHLSHKAAESFLSIYSKIIKNPPPPPHWRSLKWKNLYFPNPLGPAGGMDKNAKHFKAWWAFGAGFVEIGTVTPTPQKSNPGSVLKRNFKKKVLWNHLGFPGDGMTMIKQRLKKVKQYKTTPIFINISKNRNTKNEKAHEDYIKCISTLYDYADAFVINISSPNTKNLINLSSSQNLKKFLRPIQNHLKSYSNPKPFFIKWSPDIPETDFLKAVDIALEEGAQGHIICNTSQYKNQDFLFPDYGGISGAPLAFLAKIRLKKIINHLGTERKQQMVISVGGILNPADVYERLSLGADLTQVYSALVFNTPLFFQKVFKYSQKKT